MRLKDFIQNIFCTPLRKKNNRLETKVAGLEEKVESLKDENKELVKENSSVRENNETLRKKIDGYKMIVRNIKENKVL